MAAAKSDDIELKFAGKGVERVDGAPAELVAASLIALQRLTHLIGMKNEGRVFGQRAKPSARVRREYAVICRQSESGSYVQPIAIENISGQVSSSAMAARLELLETLRALDSGDPEEVERAIPNARQRWFMAEAAAGLLPPAESEIEVTLRPGKFGRFTFQAGRARTLIDSLRSGEPPAPETETIVGKLKALDFSNTALTLKPATGRALRTQYPLVVEPFLQRNVRKRLSLTGQPDVNSSGDVVGFRTLETISELEPSSRRIESFMSENKNIRAVTPLPYSIIYDTECRLFIAKVDEIGLDAFSPCIDEIEAEVLSDLAMLWRNYATAPDGDLTQEALAVKRALNAQFVESQ